jgi:hypothetical protein
MSVSSKVCPLGMSSQKQNYIYIYELLSFDSQNEKFSGLFTNTRTCNLRPQCVLH